jgi:(5-formylfuran-3-yl)methyl phosphate synthase
MSASRLLDRRRCRLSVALGELLDESWLQIDSLLADFDYSKVALSRCVDRTDWTTRVDLLAEKLGGGKRLILVHYADYRLAQSPTWQVTVEAARRLDCKYVLIDTHDKSAGRLWDWYSPADIRALAADAQRNGLQLSIAGSLKIDELSMARSLGASIIGVRSAACQDSSRVEGLCHDRLRTLSEIFSNQAVTS